MSEAPIGCMRCAEGHYVMRTRRADGHTFYGCSNFPRCKHSVDSEAIPALRRWTESAMPASDAVAAKLTPQEIDLVRRVARMNARPRRFGWGTTITRANAQRVVDRIAPDYEHLTDMEMLRMGLKPHGGIEDSFRRREAYDEAWEAMRDDFGG